MVTDCHFLCIELEGKEHLIIKRIVIPANLDDRICIQTSYTAACSHIIHAYTSFLNNATSMIEAGCGIILHGFICMFKACSDRSVPYI